MQNQQFDLPSFSQGVDACIEGISRLDNPYKDGTLCSDSWSAGWIFWNTADEF